MTAIDQNRTARRLKAMAADRRREADELEILADEVEGKPADPDPWLTLPEIKRRTGRGRDAVLGAHERGELELHRAPGRGDIQARQSAVDAWHAGKPLPPKASVGVATADHVVDEFEREFQRMAGGTSRA